MDLYPAIDIRGGRCVRLVQGDYGRETAYGDDPVAVARAYEAAGAPWVHVVDLDAARTGLPVNREVVAAIAGAVAVPVQAGGGVRNQAAAEALFAAGVRRVVLGTAALEQPELVGRLAAAHPGGVAVGLDGRGAELAVRGWVEGPGADLFDVLGGLDDAVAAVVITEIGRDGMLSGPDLVGLARALATTSIDLVASGGVGSLADLADLAALESGGRRLAGAIVGKALYERVFTVEQAVAAVGPR